MSTKLSEFENAVVGMVVGVVEVSCLQPLNYWKNMAQQGQPLSLNPFKLYRGVGANMLNMGSCTMVQFAVGGDLKKRVLAGEERELKAWEEMMCGLGGGIVSALVGSPLELVMIQQQRKGTNVAQTVYSVSSPSIITRGLLGCAIREGLWTVGYLSIPPIVRRSLMESYPDTFDSASKARIPASLIGAFFGCYFTHPADTIKTCMQGDIERVKFGNFFQTGRVVYSERGIGGFFRGAQFRYGRMIIAVGLMDTLQGIIGPLIYPSRFA